MIDLEIGDDVDDEEEVAGITAVCGIRSGNLLHKWWTGRDTRVHRLGQRPLLARISQHDAS